ncbi:hypothetical protein [Crossiella cryophila]|uniref:Uncharacterized protein n=1 Tax=Crossiella cryophila TaxID=43355 RepID=A0A7W7CIM7_9PSEU|nr:hypothetical protein [Crossiella cryophila]MBB4681825.1 hypothetical protein [Crossiella cryophila]
MQAVHTLGVLILNGLLAALLAALNHITILVLAVCCIVLARLDIRAARRAAAKVTSRRT